MGLRSQRRSPCSPRPPEESDWLHLPSAGFGISCTRVPDAGGSGNRTSAPRHATAGDQTDGRGKQPFLQLTVRLCWLPAATPPRTSIASPGPRGCSQLRAMPEPGPQRGVEGIYLGEEATRSPDLPIHPSQAAGMRLGRMSWVSESGPLLQGQRHRPSLFRNQLRSTGKVVWVAVPTAPPGRPPPNLATLVTRPLSGPCHAFAGSWGETTHEAVARVQALTLQLAASLHSHMDIVTERELLCTCGQSTFIVQLTH